MFRFSAHPAAIGITTGVGDAWHFLWASWRKWVPAAAALAALQFVLYLIFVPDFTTFYSYDRYTGRTVFTSGAAERIPQAVAGLVAIGLLGMVVGWVFYAVAIGGLRNRVLAPRQILVRGLLTLLSGVLIWLAAIAAIVLVAVVIVAAPPMAILLIPAAIVLFIYVEIRLIFSGMAIFDGFGPIEGLRESWRLSQGSVLRLFGWGLMAVLLGWAFGVVVGLVATPLTLSGDKGAEQALTYSFQAVTSCFTVFLMAVLYESQRARFDPTLYPYPPMPAYPGYGAGPYGAGPYGAAPYPPAPYAAGPYASGPYPPAPYGAAPYPPMPSYPAPYAAGPNPSGPWALPPYATGPVRPQAPGVPPGWPPYPTPAPGWPANPYPAPPWQTGPNAPPVWVSNEPDAPPPAAAPNAPVDDAKLQDPPASS